MISILIVDDNSEKAKRIISVLDLFPELNNAYDVAADLVTARGFLSKKRYDLLLLDLQLPQRHGDDAESDSGVRFISEISQSARLLKPIHIVGITAHDELRAKYSSEFENNSWAILFYNPVENAWEIQIKKKVAYLISVKREWSQATPEYQFDLAIITALSKTELEAVLHLNANWQSFSIPNDATEYHKGIFLSEGRRISVIAAAAPQMGMVASAVLTTKMIEHFRPKYVAMTGIAAGLPGKGNFGDILIADLAFDSGSGKIATDTNTKTVKFEPDYRSIDLTVDLQELFASAIRNRDFVADIQHKWPAEPPPTVLSAQMGPVGSGAGVIENEEFVEQIRGHSRKLLGVDMETYGVYYAVKNSSKPRPKGVMSLKSISDFANPTKNDKYQKYAAYTSASYLYNFIVHKLPLD
jgi:nucleoside phosphorylase/CheY-like chemotaxis protein